MAHTQIKQNTQEFKTNVLQPVLDDWNRVIREDWVIESSRFDNSQVIIKSFSGRTYIHGHLLTSIAGICNAFDWTWALYSEGISPEDKGIEIRIN